MYAVDALTLDELRSRLDAIEETRESLQALERDKDGILESYATRAPEALADLGPEERRTVYFMLGLRVEALLDRSLRVCGAFGEEKLVWQNDRTSTR